MKSAAEPSLVAAGVDGKECYETHLVRHCGQTPCLIVPFYQLAFRQGSTKDSSHCTVNIVLLECPDGQRLGKRCSCMDQNSLFDVSILHEGAGSVHHVQV